MLGFFARFGKAAGAAPDDTTIVLDERAAERLEVMRRQLDVASRLKQIERAREASA